MQCNFGKSNIINAMVNAAQQSLSIVYKHFLCLDKGRLANKAGLKNNLAGVDLAVEDFLIHNLSLAEPSYGFFTEELYPIDNKSGYKYRWIIDPIDGSFNFLHGNPNFGLTIAVEKINLSQHSEILASVILLPMLNQLYWAEKNVGAFCAQSHYATRIHFSTKTNWSDLLLASGEKETCQRKLLMRQISKKRFTAQNYRLSSS